MFIFCLLTWTDSFQEQLIEDSAFLRAERRLDTERVDKVILQLNRIYPQILTDKEATKVSPHETLKERGYSTHPEKGKK